MQFDIDGMAPTDRYELLLGTIVPRPIALITTLDIDGRVNAAPYSLFNVMGHDPAVAMFSVLAHPEARLKDTSEQYPCDKGICHQFGIGNRCVGNEYHLHRRAAGSERA